MTANLSQVAGGGGLLISVERKGTPGRSRVILGHGGGQTRHSWGKAADALAGAGYDVLNYDARGHGDSEWARPEDYSAEKRSEDVAALAKMGNGPVALVGASMGGLSALYFAAKHPSEVSALILVDIVTQPEPAGVRRVTDFMARHLDGFDSLEEVADAVASYAPHRPRRDAGGFQNNLRLKDGRYYWHWDPAILHQDNGKMFRVVNQVVESNRARLDFPVMLVRGMKSDIISDAGIDNMRELLPQAEIFEVDGAGHMVAGDRNDQFNAGVIEFLRKHVPPCHDA